MPPTTGIYATYQTSNNAKDLFKASEESLQAFLELTQYAGCSNVKTDAAGLAYRWGLYLCENTWPIEYLSLLDVQMPDNVQAIKFDSALGFGERLHIIETLFAKTSDNRLKMVKIQAKDGNVEITFKMYDEVTTAVASDNQFKKVLIVTE